ncbi:MAG: transporter substrate-binding domain-containing protein [Sciscionella sp.]
MAAAAIIAACCSLAACGGTSSSSENKLGTMTSGTIKFAFRSDDKPVSFVKDGKPTGFMIELTRAMAKKMGVTADYVATDFASMLPNVRNHQYDSAAFGVLMTPKREKVVDFTTPVKYSQARLISRKAARVDSIAQANGKTVAITVGSALIPVLQKKTPGVQVKQFPNVAASANALKAGQVDGLFTGVATTASLLKQHPDFTATQSVTTGSSAFPVAKDKHELKKALDSALAAVIADGTYTALFDKWHPKGLQITQDMLNRYPGMKQRPGSTHQG